MINDTGPSPPPGHSPRWSGVCMTEASPARAHTTSCFTTPYLGWLYTYMSPWKIGWRWHTGVDATQGPQPRRRRLRDRPWTSMRNSSSLGLTLCSVMLVARSTRSSDALYPLFISYPMVPLEFNWGGDMNPWRQPSPALSLSTLYARLSGFFADGWGGA